MRRKSWVLSFVVLGGMCVLFAPQRSWSQAYSAQPPAIVNSVELPDAPGEQVQSAGQPAPNAPQPPAKAGAETPSSPNAGDVSGTVTDTNGNVVPRATVSIENNKIPVRQSQAANDNGFFEFKNVAPGDSY